VDSLAISQPRPDTAADAIEALAPTAAAAIAQIESLLLPHELLEVRGWGGMRITVSRRDGYSWLTLILTFTAGTELHQRHSLRLRLLPAGRPGVWQRGNRLLHQPGS